MGRLKTLEKKASHICEVSLKTAIDSKNQVWERLINPALNNAGLTLHEYFV